MPGASRVEIAACLGIIGPDEKADEGEPPTGPPRGRLGEGELPPPWRVVSRAEASGGPLARSGASPSLLPAHLSRELTSRLRLWTSSPGLTGRSGSAVARERRAARSTTGVYEETVEGVDVVPLHRSMKTDLCRLCAASRCTVV